MKNYRTSVSLFLALFSLLVVVAPKGAHAWGNEGHRMINRLAAEKLPADVPEFLRAALAANEIEYLGPEPDRWRNHAEEELVNAQAPEHFIDLEWADELGPLPKKRFDFLALAYKSGKDPAKIGLQPWEATEVWERLKVALREYRVLKAAGKDTKPVEAAAIFYAGWLGHYVGDASQPLHTSIKYNGWVGENPKGYTTEHKIHWQFEGPFVGANIKPEMVVPKMTTVAEVKGDFFAQYVAYLRETQTHVERVYELEKAGGFVGAGSQESRDFAAERLAVGASKLRDVIYTAWLRSGDPIEDPYAGK